MDKPSQPQEVKGQWQAVPSPPDFVALVAAVTGVATDVRHLTEDVRDARRAQDQYIVEHRSQHAEDRAQGRAERGDIKESLEGSIVAAKASLAEVVAAQSIAAKERTRIYIGLLTTGIGAVIVDIVLRIVQHKP